MDSPVQHSTLKEAVYSLICSALPTMSRENISAVAQFIMNEKPYELSDLTFMREEDLTPYLTKVQARKLISFIQKRFSMDRTHTPFLPLVESSAIRSTLNTSSFEVPCNRDGNTPTLSIKQEIEEIYEEKRECISSNPVLEIENKTPSEKLLPLKRKHFPLPKFSDEVQPILRGDLLSDTDHAKLSTILKQELISFLNRENLICSGNSSNLRWGYRNLGETLVSKYPKMQWDLPSKKQKRTSKQSTPIYAVFIHRLSLRRKMQRLRLKTEAKKAADNTNNPVFALEISPEGSMSLNSTKPFKLKAVKTQATFPSSYHRLNCSLVRQKTVLGERLMLQIPVNQLMQHTKYQNPSTRTTTPVDQKGIGTGSLSATAHVEGPSPGTATQRPVTVPADEQSPGTAKEMHVSVPADELCTNVTPAISSRPTREKKTPIWLKECVT